VAAAASVCSETDLKFYLYFVKFDLKFSSFY